MMKDIYAETHIYTTRNYQNPVSTSNDILHSASTATNQRMTMRSFMFASALRIRTSLQLTKLWFASMSSVFQRQALSNEVNTRVPWQE